MRHYATLFIRLHATYKFTSRVAVCIVTVAVAVANITARLMRLFCDSRVRQRNLNLESQLKLESRRDSRKQHG